MPEDLTTFVRGDLIKYRWLHQDNWMYAVVTGLNAPRPNLGLARGLPSREHETEVVSLNFELLYDSDNGCSEYHCISNCDIGVPASMIVLERATVEQIGSRVYGFGRRKVTGKPKESHIDVPVELLL